MWAAGLLSALSIKLTSSIDDVVWLAPFLTSNSSVAMRIQNSVIYTSVCLTQTLVAMVIAYSGKKAVRAVTGGNKDAWSPEKILTCAAGCMLAVYSIKLSYEYYQELQEGGEEEPSAENENPESGMYNKVATDPAAGDAELAGGKPASNREMVPGMEIDSPDKAQEVVDKADQERSQTLFVIAFIGSVDDLTLFVPMLVGKGFDIVQLMLGSFIAVLVILSMCIFIGLCKPMADCLAKIPLAAIVIVFAIMLLLKGFVFEEK